MSSSNIEFIALLYSNITKPDNEILLLGQNLISASDFDPNYKIKPKKDKHFNDENDIERLKSFFKDEWILHYDPPKNKNFMNNTKYEQCLTPLMTVLHCRNIVDDEIRIKLAKMIVEHPLFDPNVKNHNGKTVLYYCFDCGKRYENDPQDDYYENQRQYYFGGIHHVFKGKTSTTREVFDQRDHFMSYDYIQFDETKKQIADMIMSHPKFNKHSIDVFGRTYIDVCEEFNNDLCNHIINKLNNLK